MRWPGTDETARQKKGKIMALPKNVKRNKKEKIWTVQTFDGKVKTYKTERGALARAKKLYHEVFMPPIIKANTYHWSPSGSASSRRSKEEYRMNQMRVFADQFKRIPTIELTYHYEESCRIVRKKFIVEINGKKSNITGLIGEAARWGIEINE